MTLEEMAEEVCATARASDTAAVERAKKYLARRYEMIWNEALWKDAIWGYNIPFDQDADQAFGNQHAMLRGAWLFPECVGQVLAVRRTEEPLTVANQFDFYRESLDAYEETGDPIKWLNLPKICAYSDIVGTDVDDSMNIRATAAADEGGEWKMRFLHRNGDIRETSGNLTLTDAIVGPVEAILRFSKPEGTAAVLLQNTDTAASILSVAATVTELPLRCRIQLLPMPTAALNLKTLVKWKCPPLEDDTAEAQISGIDNCLVTFALGDMLRRARQYGKAEVVFQEAMGLLAQLKQLGVWQEACVQRITPEVTEVSGNVEEWRGKERW
jgi:hypothetical protein